MGNCGPPANIVGREELNVPKFLLSFLNKTNLNFSNLNLFLSEFVFLT